SNHSEEILEIPVPDQTYTVLVHPDVVISTKAARKLLKPEIFLSDHVRQSGFLAGFIAGCFRGDLKRATRNMVDLLIEPQRSSLIPGFYEIKKAAQKAGAMAFSISGSGPSVFAWTDSEEKAERVRKVIDSLFHSL